MEQCCLKCQKPCCHSKLQTCVSYRQSVFVFVWWSSNNHVEFLEKDDDVSHSTPKKRGFSHLGRVDRDVCGKSIHFVFCLVYVNLVFEVADFVAMFR